MPRATPPAAVDLIQRFEGWSATPYLCPAGYWTIGWGALRGPDAAPVTRATPAITAEQGLAMLVRDLRLFEAAVLRLVRLPLTDGQYGALVSFTFNLGAGRLQASTLLRRVNEGRFDLAADEFPRWVMAGGRRLPGLAARRAAEREMFLAPDPVVQSDAAPPADDRLARFLRSFNEALAGA